MAIRIGINGFGRIGRLVCRMASEDANIQVVSRDQVIDRYNFELLRAAHQISKGQSTDSAKAIDCNARSHRE